MQRALSSVSFDAPAGDLAGGRQSINVRTTASVTTAEAFEALEIKPNVFVGDVAKVTLGPTSGETALRANARQAFGIGIIRQATSNTFEISSNVRAVVAQLNETLPEDVNIFVTSDDATFISGWIAEVLKSLGFVISIVVAVILLFLRDIRATLIPALTLPVALVGTFAAIYIVGFSINNLTLLALVLATGILMATTIRQELTPPEDRAVALLSVTAPQGVALEYTQTKMRQIEDLIVPLQDAGEVTNIFSISGFGADNRGFMVFTLAKWGDRIRS